jgi:DNA-binding CsgD family transcriptional regulator
VVVASPPGDIHGLTTRELEILGLLIEGWSNAQIAHQLILAPRTVATHVEHILAKLGVLSRAHAAVLAERDGIYIPHGLQAGADAPGSVDLPMRRRRVRGEGG